MASIRQILCGLGDLKSRIKESYPTMSENQKNIIYNKIISIMGEL